MIYFIYKIVHEHRFFQNVFDTWDWEDTHTNFVK